MWTEFLPSAAVGIQPPQVYDVDETLGRSHETMKSIGEEIEVAIMGLPASERARLAKRLIESLDEDPSVTAAWDEEIGRRVAAIEAGEAELVRAGDVVAEARKRLAG